MTEPSGAVKDALRYLDVHFEDFKRTLSDLARIPSMSAAGFPGEEVRRSAESTAEALRRARLEHVQVLEIPGVHPYVYGDWLGQPGAPTILLYGHHDVQPPGRPEKWLSPAFEPTEREGRLYGRGTADDKGGVMAHVAAVAAYLESVGSLPCNVKFLVEGEEEIGSQHLGDFLAKYRKLMAADFIVLSDTSNFDTGIPALTYQLICQVDVEVQCLAQPVHSGGWGGPVPDAVRILCGLIAGLEAKDGSLDVPGLYRKVARPSRKQLDRIRRLPFREAKFKREAGMLGGTTLAGERGYSVYERLWTRPALTVIALEARPFLGSSNQIIEAARARLSLRTVPEMDAREAGRLLVKKLTERPPRGAKVTARVTGATPTREDAVAYTILESRSHNAARQVLNGYAGIVMADGYGAYDALARAGPGVTLAHCWAHVRRKFVEAEPHYPGPCGEVLDLIGQLYAVERACPALDPAASEEAHEHARQLRGAARREQSIALVDAIRAWAYRQRALPESSLGKAIAYMLGLWAGLTRFLGDARIPLDNNATERGLRGMVIGRKNHYGSRSKRGTEVAALFYSLIETAKLAGVNPKTYLLEATHAALENPGTALLPNAPRT